MTQSRMSKKLFVALTVNAALVGVLLLTVAGRGPAAAVAQPLPAALGGGAARGGMTVMPAQMTVNTYGCFVLDADHQTLTAYQFLPGEKDLKLVAARDVQYDRQLTDFNTAPSPTDVRHLVEEQDRPSRSAPAAPRSPERPTDR